MKKKINKQLYSYMKKKNTYYRKNVSYVIIIFVYNF